MAIHPLGLSFMISSTKALYLCNAKHQKIALIGYWKQPAKTQLPDAEATTEITTMGSTSQAINPTTVTGAETSATIETKTSQGSSQSSLQFSSTPTEGSSETSKGRLSPTPSTPTVDQII
ncbi:unnamed protein product [Anisakis simplex]|uniref:Uncharacterized protein n=1 Tax=Anisakis simplex TaxID=6269 RepID=A0A0M3J1P7_ANISI|nr:unnamed protein product [Anisakis simplex]